MVEVSPDEIPWSSDDEANWRAFLQTKTGSKLLPKLLEVTPALLSGGGANEIFIRSGEVRGVQIIAREMFALTHAKPLPSFMADAYPDLDDNSKWPEEKSPTV